jgi:hypothetical protein
MDRPGLAFLIAPLWVPLIVTLYAAFVSRLETWVPLATIISLLFAYAGTLLFGVPTYLLLRRWPLALLVAGLLVGFGAGVMMWNAFFVLFGLSLGHSLQTIATTFSGIDLQEHLYWSRRTGTLGSLVGLTLWFIGCRYRPTT